MTFSLFYYKIIYYIFRVGALTGGVYGFTLERLDVGHVVLTLGHKAEHTESIYRQHRNTAVCLLVKSGGKIGGYRGYIGFTVRELGYDFIVTAHNADIVIEPSGFFVCLFHKGRKTYAGRTGQREHVAGNIKRLSLI